jgi:AcrR family transcriptional regulator
MDSVIRTYTKKQDLLALRRNQIAVCAARLFAKSGYDHVSVREISAACGIGIGALYRYIATKDDILYLVMDYGLSPFLKLYEDMEARLDIVNPTEGLAEAIDKHYRMVDKFQDVLRMAYMEIRNLQPRAIQSVLHVDRCFLSLYEGILNRGYMKGEFKACNTTVIAHNIMVDGHMWAVRNWFLKSCCTLETYISEQIEFTFRAICTEKALQTKTQ